MEGTAGIALIALELDLPAHALDPHGIANGLGDADLATNQFDQGGNDRPGPCREAVVLEGHPPPDPEAPVRGKIARKVQVSRPEAHLGGAVGPGLLTPVILRGVFNLYPLHGPRKLAHHSGKIGIVEGEAARPELHGASIVRDYPHALGAPPRALPGVDAHGNGRSRGKPQEVLDPHRCGLLQDEAFRLDVYCHGELAQGWKGIGKILAPVQHGGPHVHSL